MKLVFATHNINKLNEIQALMPKGITLLSLDEIGCHEDIEENASTIEGNAIIKAEYIYKKYGYDVFADDTGLEVEALYGAPGVYSARYAGEPKNDANNVALLLKNLENQTHRKARFKTVIAYIKQGKLHTFEGIAKGEITQKPKGNQGFGYDPVFQPEGLHQTFAQLSAKEKNAISHRGKAFQKLLDFLS